MYKKDHVTWLDDEAVGMLESTLPKNFHKVLATHYRERLQQVIQKGLKYTAQHFFVKDSIKYHEKQLSNDTRHK